MVREADLPADRNITVLFDAYYPCPTVVQAVEQRGWHSIRVGKSNCRLGVGRQSHRLSPYGPNCAGLARRKDVIPPIPYEVHSSRPLLRGNNDRIGYAS